MPSKLELICAELRRLAADADGMARTAEFHVRQVEELASRATAVARRPRGGELVSTFEGVARQLRRDVVIPLTLAARRNREIAAQLCGGSAVSAGSSAGPVVLDPVGAAHGGHGGTSDRPVPPAREPIEDVSRERIEQVLDGGAGRPEDLPEALVTLRLQWVDAGGHGALRHTATNADDAAQRDRCTRGHDPITGNRTDWETGRDHKYGRDASAFVTAAALIYAEARLWRTDTAAQERATTERDGALFCPVKVDASVVLGPRFAEYLRGYERLGSKNHPTGSAAVQFPPDTKIFAVYKRDSTDQPWYLYTIYPWRPSP